MASEALLRTADLGVRARPAQSAGCVAACTGTAPRILVLTICPNLCTLARAIPIRHDDRGHTATYSITGASSLRSTIRLAALPYLLHSKLSPLCGPPGAQTMTVITKFRRFGEHQNAFGFLRLLFASLVIVSHTIEVNDGNSRREPLTRLFGTLTFGQFAVAGFFLISGFLITASYLKSSSPEDYMRKRITRIYPGFIICSVICMVAFGPLGGGDPPVGVKHAVIAPIIRALILCPPVMDNVFMGSHYRHLNGAAWTIQYELLCYIVVLALGTLRMIDKPVIVIVLSAICLVSTSVGPQGISEFLN